MPDNSNALIPEDTTNTNDNIYTQIKHLNGYQGQIAARQQPMGYFPAGTELMSLIKDDLKLSDVYTNYSIYVARLGISTSQNGCQVKIKSSKNSGYATICIGDQRVPNPTHLYEIQSPDDTAIKIKSIQLVADSDPDMLVQYIAFVDQDDKNNW